MSGEKAHWSFDSTTFGAYPSSDGSPRMWRSVTTFPEIWREKALWCYWCAKFAEKLPAGAKFRAGLDPVVSFPDGIADFRSDTVTRPTDEMRKAMAEARVGDDVYGEDPTVNLLEEQAAEVTGKKAAVFTPTGTMGNQLGIMLQTRPGDEVLADSLAHCRNIEKGGPAALSGVAFRPIESSDGRMAETAIATALADAGKMFPRISLMVWENTHNLAGGRVLPLEVMEAGSAIARQQRVSVHLDGARIFNAEAASGISAARYGETADTVQFCFSKGLGAPAGSILCGTATLMEEARYLRKRLGGGMRQVGVLAAPALIALRDRGRLAEDHELARYLASRLAELYPEAVDPDSVETNIVMLDQARLTRTGPEIVEIAGGSGVLLNPPFAGRLRLVTHRDVDRSDVDRLYKALGG